MEYQSNGYYFINISNGYSDSGKWRTEDGRLCHEARKTGASCNDVRLQEGVVLLKRQNGDVLRYTTDR